MGYFDDLIPTGKGGLFDDLVPVPASTPSVPQDIGAEAPALSGRPRAVVPFDAPVTMPVEPSAPTGFADLIPRGVAAPQMSPNEVGRPVGDLPAFGPMGGSAPNDWARQEIARLEAARGADAGQPVNDPFAQEGMTDLLARRGQQAVQGLAQLVGDYISSGAVRDVISERSISDDAGGYVDQAMEQLRLVDEKLNSGAKLSEPERAQIMDVRRQALKTISQYSQMAPGSDLAKGIQNAEDRPAMSAGQKVAEAITQTVGAPDPRDQSFFGKVFGGLGSAAGFVGGAGLGTLLGGPVGGLVAGAGLGSETAMVEGYRQAKAAGADEETALRASKFYRVIGSGEVLPVMTALKFLPHPLKATVGSKIMKHFAHIAESSGEEALQEGMSQFFKNVTDQQLYDPDKGWMDGVGENALIGALVGGITGAGGTMLTGNEVQAPAAPQEPPVQPQAGPAGGIPPQEGVPPVTPAPIAPVTAPEAPLALTNPIQNDNAPEAVNGAAGTVSPPLAVAPAAATPPPVAAATPEETGRAAESTIQRGAPQDFIGETFNIKVGSYSGPATVSSFRGGSVVFALPDGRISEISLHDLNGGLVQFAGGGYPFEGLTTVSETGSLPLSGITQKLIMIAREDGRLTQASLPDVHQRELEAAGYAADDEGVYQGAAVDLFNEADRRIESGEWDNSITPYSPVSVSNVDAKIKALKSEKIAAATQEAPINRGPKPPAPQKRPFTSLIKRGGIRIDPDSEIADDLRHNGVTPQTAPGLFASGGLKHLDNLVADEYPEIRDLIGYEGETSYLSQQAILDALVSEAGGNPVQSAEEQAKQADWDAFQRGVASIDDDFADAPRHINYGVAPVDEDVSTQGERYRQVSSLVDEFTQEFNLAGVLTPEERDMVIDHLVANGGDAEATITGIIERRALSDENGTGIEAEEPPFPTDNAGAGSDRQSVIQPAGERTNGRGQDNGQEPSRSAEPPRSAEFPVEDTPEGQQLLVPGTDTVQTGQDQRARAEAAVRQQQSKMRRGDQSRIEDDPNSMFGTGQDNLLDQADASRGTSAKEVDTRLDETKVVDRRGRPLEVYHATDKDFETFDVEKGREGRAGIYFTGKKEKAKAYGKNIKAARLVIKNPFVVNVEKTPLLRSIYLHLTDPKAARREAYARENEAGAKTQLTKEDIARLKAQGYDGAINTARDEYIVFDADQIILSESSNVPRGSKPQVVRDAAPSQRRIADDEQTSEPRKTKPQPKGTLGPTFLDFSFTNRNSVFEAAFRDAGIEPDAARLLTVDQQIAKLREVLRLKFGIIVQLPTRTVMKKTITGRKVPVEREEISTRDAIDQMLDAYRQLQVMTHILGLPTDAVSLKKDGKPLALSLTRKLKGALGMFSYDKETNVRTIHLPGRSNSFAHEWGHALDQWLGGYLFDGTDRQIERLLSQDVFKDGMDPKATNDEQVAASFVALMRAMFTDRLKLAAMQMALERQSVETNKAGKPTKAALKAQKILKDMEAGKKPPKEVVTRYFETSAEFDEMFGTDGYFQSPHEMLARAFETYIGVQASALSDLPGGFLTKGSWAYTGSDEQRASMTFPRGMDAEKITIAFNDLASALREREVFGPGRSEMPADDDVYDMRVWNRWKPRGSLWERHKRERESAKAAAKAAKEELHKGPSKTRRVISAVDYVASTFAGHARGLVKQQPKSAQKVLTNLLDMFMTHPGSGRKITGVWEEAVTWISKGYTNKLDEIIEEFGLDPITADQQTELRRLMTVPGVKATDPRLMKAAAALRRLLDDAWRYVDSAGIPIGYTRNGWLPRILNHQAINDNQQGFMDQAAKVYSLMFDRDIRNESDFEVQAKDMLLLMRRLSGTSRPDGKGGTYKTNLFSSDDKDTLQVWQDALKVVRRRQRELDAANKDGDGDKVSAAEANLETAMEAYNDVLEDALDVLSRVFSEESAFQWKQRAELGNSMDFDTKGPSTTFLKSRTLPAEADDIMIDYYERNPITAIQSYLSMVPRRVEYVKRAGLHSEKLENMLAKAVEEGVSNKDITKIRHMIELMTGRSIRHEDSDLAWVAGWGYVTATIGILKWATASSLAEPISAGIRSGDVRDSLHALTMTLVQMTRQGDSAGRTEVGRIIGLITSATHETIMLNRFGGDIDPNNLQAKTLSNFFKYTLLTQLTNIQRTAMLATTNRIITRYLKKAIESDSEGGRKRATEELADLGIGPEDFRDMMKWLEDVGGFPSANDLVAVDGGFYNKAAELWATANARMVEQIIQNPRKFTRTMATYDPRFGPAFNITGFIYAFHFNTLLPLFKKGIDVRGEGEGKVHFGGRVLAGSTRNIALAIPAIAALYMGQTLAFILRKTLQDAFKEDDDDEEAATRILDEVLSFDGRFGFKQMFTRSGMTGATDMLYNLYTNMKYGGDLAAAYAGPHNKFWLQDMEKVLKLGAQNSPNTETAERNAAKAIMHMMGAGLTTLAVSRLPGSPLYEPLYGAGMWAIDAYGPAERLADEMYPDPKK